VARIIMKVRLSMRSCQSFTLTIATTPYMIKGVRETDIRDYYIPSPIAATRSLWPPRRTSAVPLPTNRLVRRGRD
jgi:hypothetical protein